LIYRVV